jgi:uncharacterized membrane protein YgdD (TMEM256/DUF423 family)
MRELIFGRSLVALAGLLGAAGVATAAGASHGEAGRLLGSIATIALAHAPVLLVLGLLSPKGRVLRSAALVLAAGTLLFVLDLATRQWLGQGLFTGAAPIGGGLMILGWFGIALAALFRTSFNFR